jgi:hypothetical protein
LEREKIPAEAPIIKHFQKQFNLDEFKLDWDESIGFGGCLKHRGRVNNFLELKLDVPQVEIWNGKECRFCQGTGKDSVFEDGSVCRYCYGQGKEREVQWRVIRGISATLTILSAFLSFSEVDAQSDTKQLMTINTACENDFGGGGVSGAFSVCMVNWMASREQGTVKDMVEAMKAAWARMFIREKNSLANYSFRASLEHGNGWLNVSCPGNASGLNPDHVSTFENRGYQWGPHNVDSPMQQLALIAGLAALHDLARKEMTKS